MQATASTWDSKWSMLSSTTSMSSMSGTGGAGGAANLAAWPVRASWLRLVAAPPLPCDGRCMEDQRARFGELITRYGALVRLAVAKVAGRADRDLGDEVLQRVAESLWRQVRAEKEILHPASYLYRCAVRETVRETLRRLEHDGEPAEPAAAEPLGTFSGQPEDEARGNQVEGRVRQILAALHPERSAAARAHLAGFTVEELMAMHGWTYQKARNLVARGMAELRARLTEQGLS